VSLKLVLLVGSVRSDRQGIKAARFVERSLTAVMATGVAAWARDMTSMCACADEDNESSPNANTPTVVARSIVLDM